MTVLKKSRANVLLVLFLLLSGCLAFTVQPARASGDFWVERAPMPTAAGYVQAVTINGEIYAFTSNATYTYNPSTNTWATEAPMLIPVVGFATAAYHSVIYIFGGCNSLQQGDYGMYPDNVSATTQMYIPASNTWKIEAPMPTGKALLQANVANDEIYLIAGAPPNASGDSTALVYSSENQVYYPENNSWSTAMSAPDPGFDNYASAALNGNIYVMGGQFDVFNDFHSSSYTFLYYTYNDSWSFPEDTVAPIAQWGGINANIIGAGAIAVSGNIYLVGGQQWLSACLNYTQIYNPDNNTWTTGAEIPTSRSQFGITSVDGAIYVIGGTTTRWNQSTGIGSSPTNANEEYLPLGYQEQTPSPYSAATKTTTASPTTTVPELPPMNVIVAIALLVAALLVTFVNVQHGRKTNRKSHFFSNPT